MPTTRRRMLHTHVLLRVAACLIVSDLQLGDTHGGGGL